MQTIRFLPDRLNAEPVVFRGFTAPEMGLAALAGVGAGSGLVIAPAVSGGLGDCPDRDAGDAAAWSSALAGSG
ncbi:conjugative transfer region protein [Cedecea neteri]|uniref:Conjugative transfer region protein n=1 Tax=Cedecea neteri TaxID=158822 RepID=A0A2X2SXQ9_9ENTR|nr:conjugative transfer region protein [Cedecea neteri]